MSNCCYVVTGAARRGGAAIVRELHSLGHRVILHARHSSSEEAHSLCDQLNHQRTASAELWLTDLGHDFPRPWFADEVAGIVANASQFTPSSLSCFENTLEDDLASHLTGHLRLIRYCLESLKRHQGAIVAIGDTHLNRPNPGYFTYHIAKSALVSAMQVLAVELAPDVRVNTVMPGSFEWPVNPMPRFSEQERSRIVSAIPLKRNGKFEELARTVRFLLCEATYVTGAMLPVDGGLSLRMEGDLDA
ncbi:MAG: SDR family oxidoreductase [Betaproteobacteria bacterium]|jgi:Dehydrogenases with different specificities (related to short-chain alcohol dehydrogenases)|nr:SDR family oxidoreductase [Betaproteobacteria bacterium]